MDDKDFVRFLRGMREFNRVNPIGSLYLESKIESSKVPRTSKRISEPLVELNSYCLNPNHFHFLIKQLVDNGISKFMLKLGMGYANYFNVKYSRSGSLFQGKYKAIHVKKYGYLLKLLVYVNCNYEIHGLGRANKWIWSSYLDSIGKRNGTLCNLHIINEEFRNLNEFKEFCKQVLAEIKINKNLQKYLLE
jgi:putative transposase